MSSVIYLGVSSYATHETTERDDLLFGDDILEVLGRSVEWHFLDRLGRLAGVLDNVR